MAISKGVAISKKNNMKAIIIRRVIKMAKAKLEISKKR
jgi:hypothetical protein